MKFIILAALTAFTLSSCNLFQKKYTPHEVQEETKRFNAFLEEVFEQSVARSPGFQTYLGRKTNYDKLDDASVEFDEKEYAIDRQNLKDLQGFTFEALDAQAQISYKIFKDGLENGLAGYKFRYHNFPLNQMFGYHAETPSFMINMHTIDNEQEAEAYISRLKEFKRVFEQKLVKMKIRENNKILPPKFVFPKVLEASKNIITGQPFTQSKKDSPLLADFKRKLQKLKINPKRKSQLIAQARAALKESVEPAYVELINYVTELDKKVSANNGIWALPDGKEFYNYRLKRITTTDMTADEIHQLGLKEVARIKEEMNKIKDQVGFKGSLKEFFNFVKNDKQFVYPDSKKGKQQYLKTATEIIDNMEKELPRMFNTFPKARITVKPVEAYREKSAGTAFYQGPSMEGNRPGIYYVNLYSMKDNPKYSMESLAYHEGIPGHHMQIAIATELEDLPRMRRMGGYTAYVEGWGLYSEYLPKEFGFYKDPYSDFGRLQMEIWRACRLVIDTGIHSKKWTREQAIQYFEENSAHADLINIKEVERYFIMPGQATAYKVGMLKILALREKAKSKLTDKFDIREFHDVVLKNGALPLDVLEAQVDSWLETKKL